MPAVFAVMCGLAFIWSAVKYQMVYLATIDSLPPQFQNSLTSRYAFPEYALRPSTPLELQAEYIGSLAGACVGMLCFSLACFAAGQVPGSCLTSIAFLVMTASTIKSWKTYRKNCDQVHQDGGA